MLSRYSGRLLDLALITALAAVGCSSSEEPGREPAGPDVRPLSGATAFSHVDSVRLHDREERAVAACMTARGQAYTVQPAIASARGAETNPYGLLTPQRAAADGYGIVGEYLHLRSTPPPTDKPRTKAWQQALTGTAEHRVTLQLPGGTDVEYSTDGCIARANAEVYGPKWNTLEPLTMKLASMVLATVEEQPTYRKALRRWSACMTKSGHPAADLQAARAPLNARLPAAAEDEEELRALGRDEIEAANADARCQMDTGLAEAVADVQRKVERKLLTAQNRETIARYRQAKERALNDAAE
ncbi:putative secreted protein [Streptomyces scabiei 87.22]|uniref:Putative secreted protein n=2 Tax=Streptomyces scabiei TaxID=1930 RepID=C9ZD13_STRSW|nr:hypothetical protein [Streptomyces scabiei]MDX2887185.1 hypothetical protein [Streptomyces scabiei]MDX3596722.1 hypothetical protein [Streptomyces scabiei]CBG67397.1 putative secreted protein [Streptomyces scabiei 87.22]